MPQDPPVPFTVLPVGSIIRQFWTRLDWPIHQSPAAFWETAIKPGRHNSA